MRRYLQARRSTFGIARNGSKLRLCVTFYHTPITIVSAYTYLMLRCAISSGSLALGHQRQLEPVHKSSPSHATAIPLAALSLPQRTHPVPSHPLAEPAAGHHAPPTLSDLQNELLAHATSVAARNIDFFLLREPFLPAGQLAALARTLLVIFAQSRTRLLIHSRPDVAVATRSHGVHLPSSHQALTPQQVRQVYAAAGFPVLTVSLSCHTGIDLLRARELQPDLILFGPVFGKHVQGHQVQPPVGLESLRHACTIAHPIPVLALGGITDANTLACLEAGAAGVAAIRLFQSHSK